jgi:MoxR-like ATPase
MTSQSSQIEPVSRLLQDQLLGSMKATFVGKDDIIDLMGIALIAGENLFLLGPPGTAKSALVHELSRNLQCRSFDYLLTRFTEPNEIFGPFDIRKLREGDLVTNTEGMLPEAELVFLDELLNANSAILNSLLMALNERVFRRGRETRKLPALMFVGASNHLPQEDALRALFDRFLLRAHCGPVTESHLSALLEAGWVLDGRPSGGPSPITIEQVRFLQGCVRQVSLDTMRGAYLDLIQRLRAAGLALSDRRAVKLQRVIAASAIISGRMEARVSDLWILRHIWDTEEQQEWLASIVDEAVNRAEASPGDHPRARTLAPPDPELLGKDLSSIEQAFETHPKEVLRDHLSALGSRIEWIAEDTAREALKERIAALWARIDITAV